MFYLYLEKIPDTFLNRGYIRYLKMIVSVIFCYFIRIESYYFLGVPFVCFIG